MPDPEEKTQKQDKVNAAERVMSVVFDLLLKAAGGSITIPCEVIRAYPKNLPLKMEWDETNDVLHVLTPLRKKRGKIITPDKRILVSN